MKTARMDIRGVREQTLGSQVPTILTEFYCNHCPGLTEIPPLPLGLEIFHCTFNPQLKSLPDLSLLDSLVEFNCTGSGIERIGVFPKSLKRLDCSYCKDITIIDGLPDSLIELNCTSTSITTLPKLPPGLKILNISCNKISRIDELPKGLLELKCNYTLLESLPVLPSSLTLIECAHTKLNPESIPSGIKCIGLPKKIIQPAIIPESIRNDSECCLLS